MFCLAVSLVWYLMLKVNEENILVASLLPITNLI